ncbi:MAG TPA: Clp protease N-terminal domain-containing protein [Actinomycetota bacterium]|jgi:ATP-dependent Clp protease ATP-binding subunit ClpC|nr:Clp protease N-terminal domain-containing protein [Actinomycetota bacterium]
MFERFTERARRVVVLAQEESREMGHDHIGTEHLLLALIREQDGIAGQVLGEAGITLESARKQVEAALGRGEPEPKRRSGKRWRRHVPFTARAKKTMELALRESLGLGHNYIGTEHLLLGLLSLGEGAGSEALANLGASPAQLRESVLKLARTRPEGPTPTVEFRETEFEMREASFGEAANPRCPKCHSDLAETATVRSMDLPIHDGEGTRTVAFVFCRRCGSSLGILGG